MKKIIAVATVAALSAQAAQADTVNVNIYGRIRVAAESISGSGAPNSKNSRNQIRVVDNSSVLGFKGAEDLGDGLVLGWQAEGQLEGDGDSDGKLNSRNTFLSLKTDTLGTLLIGKYDTPYKQAGRFLRDTSLSDTTGEIAAILNRGSVDSKGAQQNFYTRQASTLQYLSPKWAGFDVRVGYAPDETKNSTADKHRFSLALGYENDLIQSTAGYETRSDASGTDSADALLLTLGVKIGKSGHVTAGWEKIEVGSADQTNLFLAGKYKFTDTFSVSAQIANADDVSGKPNTGARLYGVGTQYDLSKRTNVAAYYTVIYNDDAAAYNFNDNAIDALVAGKNPRVFGIGLNHSF